MAKSKFIKDLLNKSDRQLYRLLDNDKLTDKQRKLVNKHLYNNRSFREHNKVYVVLDERFGNDKEPDKTRMIVPKRKNSRNDFAVVRLTKQYKKGFRRNVNAEPQFRVKTYADKEIHYEDVDNEPFNLNNIDRHRRNIKLIKKRKKK